jgi:uncharacterized OB-fold protein
MSVEKPFTIKSYYDFLREKKIMGNLCEDCKTLMVPPRMTCMGCKGKRLRWTQFGGEGSLESFTVVHVAPNFLKDKAPYALGIIRLKEGPMLTARLVGVDVRKPEMMTIGMAMIADYVEEEGKPLLIFKPL